MVSMAVGSHGSDLPVIRYGVYIFSSVHTPGIQSDNIANSEKETPWVFANGMEWAMWMISTPKMRGPRHAALCCDVWGLPRSISQIGTTVYVEDVF
jgi:hypothetical protein